MLGIVTPVKNECKNLEFLSRHIFSQTRSPSLWVIVDDGSSDNTPRIISNLSEKYDFIIGLSLPTKHMRYDPIYRYGFVVRSGLSYALSLRDDLEFLGILDVDIKLKNDYYEKILDAFESKPRLGIVSGRYLIFDERTCPRFRERSNEIIGGAMIFRKKCLLDIGGFPVCPSPDIVALIKAVNRGWRLGLVSSTYAIHTRVDDSWTKSLRAGLSKYTLGLHPLSALLGSPLQALKNLSLNHLGFTVGYFIGVLSGTQKLNDREINKYFYERFYLGIYRRFMKITTKKSEFETDPIKRATIRL